MIIKSLDFSLNNNDECEANLSLKSNYNKCCCLLNVKYEKCEFCHTSCLCCCSKNIFKNVLKYCLVKVYFQNVDTKFVYIKTFFTNYEKKLILLPYGNYKMWCEINCKQTKKWYLKINNKSQFFSLEIHLK